MRVYIATDRKDAIVIFRIITRTTMTEQIPTEEFVPRFNSLASSNNLEELLLAIEALPALIPLREITELGNRRTLLPGELLERLDRDFSPCDAESCEFQAHFDAGVPEESESRRRATNRAIKHRSAHSEEFRRKLLESNSEDYLVLCEPLSDWAFARNVLGLTARLLAAIQQPDSDTTMANANMPMRYNGRLNAELYAIPFAFNPYFLDFKFNRESIQAKLDLSRYMPLMTIALGDSRKATRGMRETYLIDFDKHNEDVYLVTYPIAKEEYQSVFTRKQDIVEKRYYLCAESRGRSQKEVAQHVVVSLVNAVRNLRYKNTLLGWELDETSYYDDSSQYPRFITHSTFSELMYKLIYRQNSSITLCKECGNAILSADLGKPREFCKEACRQRHLRKAAKAKQER